MAGAGLTPGSLDPGARRVLDGYLAELEAALVGPHPALLLLAGLLAWTVTLGGLAWPLAVTAATASAMRLSLAGRAVRRCVVARQRIA